MERKSSTEVSDCIVQATIDCVIGYGLENVQVTQIAARAGISSRTLNRYFPEKDLLLSVAASVYVNELYSGFVKEYAEQDLDQKNGLQKLIYFVGSQHEFVKRNISAAAVFIDMRNFYARHAKSVSKPVESVGLQLRGIIVSCVNEGKQDGSIRADADPVLTSALIGGTFNGIMQFATLDVKRKSVELSPTSVVGKLINEYLRMLEAYLINR